MHRIFPDDSVALCIQCLCLWTSVPVLRDVSGWSFWEEMTPWLSSARYKRSRSGSHTDTKMSRWKKAGLRQGPALAAHRVLSGYSVEPKAGRWKEVKPSPRRDNLTSFFYPVEYLQLEAFQTQHMPSVCAQSGGKGT